MTPMRAFALSILPVEVTVRWLPFRARAMTVWPWILYLPQWRDNPRTQAHEHYHWHQAKRWFVIPWYLVYILLLVTVIGKPINRHPLEAPAYRAEEELPP